MRNLAFVERDMGLLDAAWEWLREALPLFEQVGTDAEIGETLVDIGLVLNDRNRLTEAVAHFERALDLLGGEGGGGLMPGWDWG